VPITDEFSSLGSDFDLSPFQITEDAHFYKIHFLFSMLGLSHAFITRNGAVVGIISKKIFLQKTKDLIVW
jgi:signal-transduction protein with cAMP-binding, CBS, and nucleotidyltransferase domain